MILERDNNYDLLRFALAFIVFLVHLNRLSGNTDFAFIEDYLDAEIAVYAFFVISGYLIFMSYENSRSLYGYAKKRAKRILPAYITVVLSCALLGALISDLEFADYFGRQWLNYVLANLVFLNFIQESLPGVFDDNVVDGVNFSLWTIKVEIMFYVSVPLIAYLMRRFNRIIVILLLYVGSLVYGEFMGVLADNTGEEIYAKFGKQLPGQLCFFISGAWAYYYSEYFRKYALILFIFALIVCFSQSIHNLDFLFPLALGIIVIYLGSHAPYMGNFGRYGDFSYGVYIINFPVLQVMNNYNLFDHNTYYPPLIATLIVLILAYLSWHTVEKPFLNNSSHYVKASIAN